MKLAVCYFRGILECFWLWPAIVWMGQTLFMQDSPLTMYYSISLEFTHCHFTGGILESAQIGGGPSANASSRRPVCRVRHQIVRAKQHPIIYLGQEYQTNRRVLQCEVGMNLFETFNRVIISAAWKEFWRIWSRKAVNGRENSWKCCRKWVRSRWKSLTSNCNKACEWAMRRYVFINWV